MAYAGEPAVLSGCVMSVGIPWCMLYACGRQKKQRGTLHGSDWLHGKHGRHAVAPRLFQHVWGHLTDHTETMPAAGPGWPPALVVLCSRIYLSAAYGR